MTNLKMDLTRSKNLGLLNESDFFCKCQMVRKGTPHQCTSKDADKSVRGPSLLERLFPDRWFSTQVIVAAIVAILIIVFAFNSWN